jgi:tetratricopeptide (TPR) repeat protein/transglutaminase-like putative cysteine protease
VKTLTRWFLSLLILSLSARWAKAQSVQAYRLMASWRQESSTPGQQKAGAPTPSPEANTAGQPPESVLQNPPAKEAGGTAATDYSKEAVVIERMVSKVAFEKDGTGTREVSVAARVQSQAGVQSLGVLTFAYLSSNENVELDYVRVRKPDGSVVVTPDYNVLDMPAEVTRTAPMYSDIHEKHVTVKALGVGDVLEYVVRFRTFKPQVPGQFWFDYSFPKDTVMRDHELQIAVPRDKYVKVVSPGYKPEIREDSEHRTYLWKTQNLEATPLEPRREGPRPDVEMTTFRSWDEVGRWYDELQAPQLATTPKLQAKATELTKGLSTDDQKIRALYDFVSTHFHYVSLSFGVGRYQPHPAEDVLENEYGDCKDKHTLLAALLKAAGIEAWPAAINATRKIDPEVPAPGQFDHVITYVPRGDQAIWLDTTPEVAPFGMLLSNLRDKQALAIPRGKPAELTKTPADPPFPTAVTFTADGNLSSDGTFTSHVEQTARGDAEVMYRAGFRAVPAARWKDLAQNISAGQGFGGEVGNVEAEAPEDIRKPFEFSYDYTRKDYGGDWANHRIIAPLPPMGVEGAPLQTKKPLDPVFLGGPGEVVYTAKIELPFDVIKLPTSVSLSQPWADFRSEYSADGKTLKIVRRMKIKQSEVPLEQWEEYQKFGKAVSDDWSAWIELYTPGVGAGSGSSTGTTPDVSSEVARKYQQGLEALQRHDLTSAELIARELLADDPKTRGAHALLGYVYGGRNDAEHAIEQFRKEEELYPDNTDVYRALATYYMRQREGDNAAEQFRKWLKVDPTNYDATAGLSQALIHTGKYEEAVTVWEQAYQLMPERSDVRYSLALAYIKAKQTAKAMPLLDTALATETEPMAFNNIAYELADDNVELDRAQKWGEKALQNLEATSLKSESEDAAILNTQSIGMTWDTVGWIYFRRGDLDQAERYLRAAFTLTQDSIVGDHLGQVLEKQSKKEEAAHYYLLALAAPDRNDKSGIRERYVKLTGKQPATATFPTPPPANPAHQQLTGKSRAPLSAYWPGEELSRARSYKIASNAHERGSATFSVVFAPGKIEDAKFISGDEKLQPAAASIAASQMRADFPNDDPMRLTRRGILVCGSSCDFTLLLPDSAHATE